MELHPPQVDAAVAIQASMPAWRDTNQLFAVLRERFPDFDPISCFAKAAAVDRLYATNVYDLYPMAVHIANTDLTNPDRIELVEEIAKLNGRRHLSFASKFAHFFIDAEHCPIYDRYALEALRFHIGARAVPGDPADYRQYVEAIAELREGAGLTCTTGELDCYLWLWGLYRWWRKMGEKAQINKEAARLFTEPSVEVKRLLDLVDPET